MEESARLNYSPYAQNDYPMQVFFGDTHVHSANSGDGFAAGARLGPEDVYRFARGHEVISSSGVPIKLQRALDFILLSDHAEGLGLMNQVYIGNPRYMADETLARWNKMLVAGGGEAKKAATEIVAAQGSHTLPAPLTDPESSGSITRTVWQEHLEISDKYNAPGKFTTMLGYEWTSLPGGNNMHRNVMFRDGVDKVSKILPFSSWDSENPEKLWGFLRNYEETHGGRVMAIPHNGNLSNGLMFALSDFSGNPMTPEYAAERIRWERLHEVMQTKGASETNPLISPDDAFADFGVNGWDTGNLDLSAKETPEMMPYEYIRPALKNGLKLEQELGTNPFKIGMIGGSDVHNSLVATQEDNFMGKHVFQEPKAERWDEIDKAGIFGREVIERRTWQYHAAGLAGVWANENSRESLWDAMHRRETYATSGTRLAVRFFGGWSFTDDDATGRNIASVGYEKGVPMGGDLILQESDSPSAPTFLLSAFKDPIGANLDRMQIIKGWLDADNNVHEKVYDVSWSDAEKRTVDTSGKLAPVGDTVDLENATWSNTIGASDLTVRWQDPDFDPSEPAFYYARVLEIPTPRWPVYDAKRFGVELDDTVVVKQQERAWTSPIWYKPS